MRLRLANEQKLLRKMILEYAFYPILHLWKDHSFMSWEIWDTKVFMAVHVVYGLTQ